MKKKYYFREPLMTDEEGLYITGAQMKFFLNRSKGHKYFQLGHPVFLSYYKNCCLYNLVYDLMDVDEYCAKMYWDEKNDCVALAFPTHGRVARRLAQISFDKYMDDEDNDKFGLFA
jgi:hypothetical protein